MKGVSSLGVPCIEYVHVFVCVRVCVFIWELWQQAIDERRACGIYDQPVTLAMRGVKYMRVYKCVWVSIYDSYAYKHSIIVYFICHFQLC